MPLRLFLQTAPAWWPFQLVSLANQRIPPVTEPGFYRILVDNGMYGFYKTGLRPSLDQWYHRLMVFVRDVERLRRPAELAVILPDWLYDPSFTLRAARHPLAKRLCSDHPCYAVAHASSGILAHQRTAEELASIDYVACLAAPLKVNCSRTSPRGRRIVRRECQLAVAQQVCGVARRHGLRCHGLGVVLAPEHVKRMSALLSSADSAAWTRPNNTVVTRMAGWSANTAQLKDRFLRLLIRRLLDAGVPLELPPGLATAD